MKTISITLFALLFHLSSFSAVPLKWTVETSRAVPAQFEAYQGETLAFEAALQSYGKPLEAPSDYALYWQTNGMGNAWWSTNCNLTIEQSEQSNNVLRATWTPSMETGAKVYNCFIGQPGTIYHAAFQLRLRPSPGALPNELPLPQKVIDFAKVTVMNPPWSGGGGGGVDTNAVKDIAREEIAIATNSLRLADGTAKPLPKYLYALDFDDSYENEANEYYRSRGNGKTDGGCSSVRLGGFLYRNFDYPFDDRVEFVVKMGAGKSRFASVGIAQVGTNLTEQIVTSGKWSKWYKALPGATVDGINENGVACNINVVDGTPEWNNPNGDIHPLAAIRWILDNAKTAEDAATSIANRVKFPQGWEQNFHYMIADRESTYIVENGYKHLVFWTGDTQNAVMTNFRLYPSRDTTGEGQERYDALMSGANITSQWWTLTYAPSGYRASDLPGITGESLTQLFDYWTNNPRESHRGETFGDKNWWQTVHTSVYDLTNLVLRIAVQETDDWYTFALGKAGTDEAEVRRIAAEVAAPMTNGLRRVEDMAVYEEVPRPRKWDWEQTGNAALDAYLASGDRLTWFDYWIFDEKDGWWTTGPGPDSDNFESLAQTARVYHDSDPDTIFTVRFHRSSAYDGTEIKKTDDRFASASEIENVLRTNEYGQVEGKLEVRGDIDAGANSVSADIGNFWELGNVYSIYPIYASGVNIPAILNLHDDGAERPFGIKMSEGGVIEIRGDRTLANYGITNAVPMSMISATDPTFSNAVLSVATGISTNDWAVIASVADWASVLPGGVPGGAGTLGAVLAALAAAALAMKKKTSLLKSDGTAEDDFATNLLGKQVSNAKVRYALSTISSATMTDRTVNILTMTQSETLTFPTATTHDNKTYARDFLLKLTYTAGTMELPQGVTKVGDELSFEAGKTYLIAFTEISADKFYVRAIDITEAQA